MAPAQSAATTSAIPQVTSAPPPPLRAQPGGDLQLLLARGRELPPYFGEAFLVLPGQHPLAGVGGTFAPAAVAAVHRRQR